jgi:hypothetical protein
MFVLTLPLFSYQHKVSRTNDLENEKYLNFLAAIQNSSTFSYFTVIKVKNLNTGETKEICTTGKFILGALHIELNAGYSDKEEQKVLNFAKSKTSRYFEFRKKKALANILFFNYAPALVAKIQTEYNFDDSVTVIKRNKRFSIQLPDDKMKAFAHVLFNKGVMTGENDCFGGSLQYVDRKKEE